LSPVIAVASLRPFRRAERHEAPGRRLPPVGPAHRRDGARRTAQEVQRWPPTSDTSTRPARPAGFARAYAAFAATRAAKFVSRHVNWKLDPILLRLTRGRLASTLVFPTAVLETRGARTGARRRNAIIYFHDGDRVTIAASNAGATRHPAWYHNLRADPDVTFGGIPMRATVVEDDVERERLWVLADRVFPAFAIYRREAAGVRRTVPLVQLIERPRDGAA
jgi:deazaflavin-dependent oxidoreductase (nitroreductase family)